MRVSTGHSLTEPRGGDVVVNHIRLHFLDWGGNGEPILIVHATGFLGRIYAPIADALRSLGHVYSYDQAGHGDSDQPEIDSINWYRTANDLEEFIKVMGFARVRAFGHSAGGTAIAAVAARRPDLITRGVLADPVIIDPEMPVIGAPAELRERTIKRRRNFSSVEAAYENFVAKPPYNTWRPDILRAYCEYGTGANSDGTRTLKCTPEVEAQIYATAREFDGLRFVLKCSVPLLVMFGEQTNTSGVVLAPRISAVPNHRVEIVPNTTHFIPMEQPETVAQMTLDFLR